MFEDICLTCSKLLPDDGRAYCSDECESMDAYNSPSISTTSSTLSSPYLSHVVDDNPLPWWSMSTDASEEEDSVSIDRDPSDEVERLGVPFNEFAPILGTHPLRQPSLNYTRCPSGTNKRSLFPVLHPRNPSVSNLTTAEKADDVDSVHKIPHNHHEAASQHERGTTKSTIGPKTRKCRNRASLPDYFSLLQVNAPRRSPPLSTLSGNTVNTINQPSPPTPKLASLLTASGLRSTVEATPHGHLHEDGTCGSRRRSQSCLPGSKGDENTAVLSRGARQESRSSVEQIFDWTCIPVTRGRTARRNSSPLPKMMLSMQEFENLALISGPLAHKNDPRPRERGRTTTSRR